MSLDRLNSQPLNFFDPHDRFALGLAQAWVQHRDVSPATFLEPVDIESLFRASGFFHIEATPHPSVANELYFRISRQRPNAPPPLYRGADSRNRLGWSWTPSYNEARGYAWRRDGVIWTRTPPSLDDVLAIWEAPFGGDMARWRWFNRVEHGTEWIVRPPTHAEIRLVTDNLEDPEPDPLPAWLRKAVGQPYEPPPEDHIPRWGPMPAD